MWKVTVYRKKQTPLTVSNVPTANFFIQLINAMWKVKYKNLRKFSVSTTSGSSNVTLFAEYCGQLLYRPV
jgi:hypothetical protein